MKKFILIILTVFCLCLAACTDPAPAISSDGIYVSGKKALAEGKSTQLTANLDVVWSSSDETIATVTSDGVVTAIGIGETTILATNKADETKVAKHTINVYPYSDPSKGVTIKSVEDLTSKYSETNKIVINFDTPFGTDICKVLDELIEDFEKEYPYIDIVRGGTSGYDAFKEALLLQIQSGTAPDIAIGYPDHFAEYLVNGGIIALDPYIKNEEVGIWDSANNTWHEDYTFYDDYLVENQQFDVNETFYGLPFNKSTEVLMYNKEFFEAFELEAPETWEDVEALCKEIYDIAKNGATNGADELFSELKFSEFVKDGSFIPFAWDSTSNLFITTVRQWGGTYTEALYNRDGTTSLSSGLQSYTSTAAVEGLTYLQGLANQGLFNVPEVWEKSYASDAFNAGQCVMTVGSSAGLSYNMKGQHSLGISNIPYNSDTNIKQVIQQGTNVCMLAQSTDEERLASWLFIKYLLSPAKHAYFSQATGYFPATAAAQNHETYQEFMEQDTAKAEAAKVNAQYKTKGFTYFTDPAWAGSSKVRDNVGTAISAILVAKADIVSQLNETIQK